jgi:hypothetical protein
MLYVTDKPNPDEWQVVFLVGRLPFAFAEPQPACQGPRRAAPSPDPASMNWKLFPTGENVIFGFAEASMVVVNISFSV